MSMSMSTQDLQGLVGEFHSRRLLLSTPPFRTPTATTPQPETHHNSSDSYTGNNSFDANVVMVLAVLLCALICSLGLNSIVRCALRCSRLVASQSMGSNSGPRLANRGVKRKALKTFPTVNYSADLNLPGLDAECVICLSDFTTGERVRLLPKCNHGFHVRCIDKWLSSNSSCPKCRHCLVETCQKIVGCSQASSSEPHSMQETVVSIAPVDREALMHSYR